MTTKEFLDRIGRHPERPLRWRTTADLGEAPMSVATFLSIHRRVAASVPIAGDGHLRVESGEPGRTGIGYPVDAVEVDAQGGDVPAAGGCC